MDGELFLVLGWGAPSGIGIFLVCLSAMILLLAKANEIDKRTKATKQQKKD